MALVKRLAVVGIQAKAHIGAAAFANLQKPIRIGQRLAGEANDIRRAAAQRLLGLIKRCMPPESTMGVLNPAWRHFRPDPGTRIDIAAKRPDRVPIRRRHALIAAASGVGVRGLAIFGCEASSNFPPRDNEMNSMPAPASRSAKYPCPRGGARLNAVFREHPAAYRKGRAYPAFVLSSTALPMAAGFAVPALRRNHRRGVHRQRKEARV